MKVEDENLRECKQENIGNGKRNSATDNWDRVAGRLQGNIQCCHPLIQAEIGQ